VGSAGFTNVQPLMEELRIFRESWSLGLRVASDVRLNQDWVLTPQITLYGGRTADTFKYAMQYGTYNPIHVVHERIRTREIGGDFAAALTWRASPWLSFNVTGRVGVVSLASDMNGRDCHSSKSCVSGTAVSQIVSDSRSRVGLRAGGGVGANIDLGYVMLSISGFVSYDSAIAGIRNPAFRSAPPVRQPRAHLYFDDGLRYGGVLALRMPLSLDL
jgi:hypothetical protein